MRDRWRNEILGNVCERVSVGHVGITSPHYRDTGIPFLRTQNVGKEGLVLDDLKYITPAFHNQLKKSSIQAGDVLLSRVITHTVNCGIVPPELGKANCANVIFARPKSSLLPEFLTHYIRSEEAQGYLLSRKVGSAQLVVNTNVVKAWPIPVPPLPEQKRIVAILDQAFDAIATAKANAEKNLQNARALFDSHLQAVFSQRGEGWVETTLDCISTNLDFMRRPITKCDRVEGKFPYYGASGIVDYVADFIFDEDALLISEDGANLLARSTPIAFSVSGKYWVNNHAHILRFGNLATQHFVEHYLESIKLDEFITGAAQPKLNQKALNSIPIPIPESIRTQKVIVDKINALKNETQHLEALYQRKLTALDDLKKSLLHQAFTGQL